MAVEIPGYQIVRVLGKGGMATVYLAVQQIFERQVALKIMSTALAEDPSFGQRFLREARIVSQLNHPNIITVFDVGVHNNAYYLSMEYIAGPDLKQAREQLTLPQKIQIVLDIAKALDFAGGKGYVHRDIKPENILLRRDNLSAVLMDFGIARAAESDLSVTQTGVALGTPHYMSPEQAKGQAVDHRSDLYSLGVVFYYLLMGSVPYHADSAVAIGIKHLTEPVPRLPEPWQPLQVFIDGLMAKLPQDRFQSAAELMATLQKLDIGSLEKRQRAYEQQLKDKAAAHPLADPTELTQLHDSSPLRNHSSLSDRFLSSGHPLQNSVPQEVTHITRINRVAGLLWQYKVVTIAAALTVFAAVVIISRPFAEKSTGVATPGVATPGVPAADREVAPPAARQPVSALEEEPEPEPTPARVTAATDITLADIADREYREVEAAPAPRAQSRPVEILQRLKHRIQDVAGRRQLRELTLEEKIGELRKTLQRYPNDLEAQRRLAWLASQYFKKANEFFSEGDFVSAQAALDKSRGLFPEYRAQHDQLAERLENRDRLERLLGQARTQLANGKLVSPWRRNALHYFEAALKTDPALTVAQRGINQVETALMELARTEYTAGNWEKAEDAAQEVLDFHPDSEAAKQFLIKLEQYRMRGNSATAPVETTTPVVALPSEKSISLREGTPVETTTTGPKIQQLRVDGKLLSGINARQKQVVPPQRTLFVSFEYENFPGEKLLLQADLKDGAGKNLAEVPVIVAEKSGLNRFRIDRPRQAFDPGEYQLSLSLDGAALITADFRIE